MLVNSDWICSIFLRRSGILLEILISVIIKRRDYEWIKDYDIWLKKKSTWVSLSLKLQHIERKKEKTPHEENN